LIAILSLAPIAALAHPHVWVDAAAEIVFDDKGRIAAIRHHWRFDEEFSAYALQGLDTDRDGKYSTQELEPLAKENVESLKDYDFFTGLSVGDYVAVFAAPRDYHLELMDGRLLLHFTLPLASPLLTRGAAVLEVGDPEYYVAFSLPSTEAVRLVNAPSACRLTGHPGEQPDAAIAAQLAQIGADQRQLPPEMQSMTAGTENTAEVNCGTAPAPSATAGGAVSAMAGAGAASGDLTALPAAPASTSVAEAAAGASRTAANEATVASQSGLRAAAAPSPAAADVPAPPPVAANATSPAPPRSVGLMRRWTAWIGGWQTKFNRDLTAGLKGLNQGEAFWWLGSVSFLYGIVHAAGPGHGKVVISTYLVANEARVRRGVVIAFIAAFVQALVAVGIIGLMAVILNMTSMAINSTAKVFETGSFALVAALGLYLLARKGRDAWTVMRGGDAHAHHHHGHGDDHHHHHGHEHALDSLPLCGGETEKGESQHSGLLPSPLPALPRKGGGLSGAAAAILSVGIRPCSGALIVLVFALSQGIFWAGVASTFVMALGTAITVAVLAALAVGAKGIARRLARGDDRRAGQVMLGLELAAAILITALGVVLFFGSIYSSGMAGSSIG
jgi:ABC-type nickel/cobalt efflux system permease component RcnA/ABC-type uncharacterized transport system substrate-binding protein